MFYKGIISSIILSLFLIGCKSPQGLLKDGQTSKAFSNSYKRLKSGKIKMKDIHSFENAFATLNREDTHRIDSLIETGQAYNWPKVFLQAQVIKERQNKAGEIVERATEAGFPPLISFYNIDPLIKKARNESAIYYHDLAVDYLDDARNGNRKAARKAYGYLNKSDSYIDDFKNANALIEEMGELGISHILVLYDNNPLVNNNLIDVEHIIYSDYDSPLKQNWRYYHYDFSPNQPYHYQVDYSFMDMLVSPNGEDVETCVNKENVQDGEREVQEWSARDSAYVTVKESIYIDVTFTVETFIQHKAAKSLMEYSITRLEDEQVIRRNDFEVEHIWENVYAKTFGDSRAQSSRCDVPFGTCDRYPNSLDLIRDNIAKSGKILFNLIEKDLDELD